jgi:diguanylate cyclase (GGDEF)-like protein
MIRNYRHHIATLTAICLAMVVSLSVPAFADDTSVTPPGTPAGATQAQETTQPAAPDPAPADPPAADPVDDVDPPAADDTSQPTTPPGGSGQGSTGATGSVDPTGPVAEDTGTPKPTDTSEPAKPQAPVVETPPKQTPESTRPTPDRTVTDTGNKGERDSATQPSGVAAGQLLDRAAEAAPAETPSPANSIGGSTRGAADQIQRNAESGVAASLVVTRIVSEIPSWVLWALAALAVLALAGLALFVRERLRRRSAEHEALVDELTGIPNRKAFDRRLDLEWRRAARYGRSLGLMVMDLDGFKQVNDLNGHAAGDSVLRSVAQSLDSRMRDTDLVARIGGDEFAVICPETGINELMTIRRQLADQATGDLAEKVGLSIGVAEFVPSDVDATSILARADQSMYRVKRGEATALPA